MTPTENLLNLAREHVEGIRKNKHSLPCLPDHIISQFSQGLCFDEILDLFDIHEDKLSLSVSESLSP